MNMLFGLFGIFALPLSIVWDIITFIVITHVAFGWFTEQILWLQNL